MSLPVRTFGRWSIVLLVMQALFAQIASADEETSDPPGEQARLAREKGKNAFEAGDYVHALDSYQSAFALEPDPRLHFNLAATYDKLENRIDALVHYDAFLAVVNEQPSALDQYAQSIAYARDRVRVLERSVSTLELGSEESWPALMIEIDGASRAAQLPVRVRLSEGQHALVAVHPDGRRWARTVHTSVGVHSAVEVSFPPPARSETTIVHVEPSRPVLGVGARTDVDTGFGGAGYAAFTRYELVPQLRVGAGAFVWPAAGDAVWGASLTAAPNIALLQALRLVAEVEAELYARAGVHPALRLGLALEWSPFSALRLVAGASVFVTAARVIAENAVFPALSVAVEVWL
jgi:tetratricopeptide (TPR) repeat protein